MSTREQNAAKFGTLIPALITLFQNDGSVDYDATVALAQKLVADGADGLVITGTTGESSTLDDDERIELYRRVKQAVGTQAKVIAGSSSNHTAHSIELSRAAAEAGADAILIVTPYYNKPTQAGIIAHVNAVAEAAGLPVMLYDIPGRSSVPMSTPTLIELSQNPLIAGLKDAKGDFGATSRILAETDLAVYSGDDGLTLPLMAAGASGVVSVSAHIDTRGYRALVDAMLAGDLESARAAHFALDPLQRGIMTHIPGAVAVKAVLKELGTIDNDDVRLPWVKASPEELAAVQADLAQAKTHQQS